MLAFELFVMGGKIRPIYVSHCCMGFLLLRAECILLDLVPLLPVFIGLYIFL